jgi:hypothetical protein
MISQKIAKITKAECKELLLRLPVFSAFVQLRLHIHQFREEFQG